MKATSALSCLALVLLLTPLVSNAKTEAEAPVNVVLIYTDDVGYGDVSCYGATEISTPNIDRLAEGGLLFTDAHATSATCTPSRYGLLTGEYPWRREGTGIARGNAGMIIPHERLTLADVFRNAGYATGVVGKWHLGLGGEEGPDWNGRIRPGANEIGFDYSFLIPATGDRVPCVFVENGAVVGLDPEDPIAVNYEEPIGDEPTGREHPELLKMQTTHGHDMTIVNGISRIGYMTGGESARWTDEDIADVITGKANAFIESHRHKPFFLFFSTHDIHVPRVPHRRFAGKSGMGPRGDVILQMDWSVGEIVRQLEELDLMENTMIIFTSDNGPALDDGYADSAVELLGDHKPAGPFRGGKYSAFEGGTRVPLIVHWKGEVQPGNSPALVSQVDLLATFAHVLVQPIPEGEAPDSINQIRTLLGRSSVNRDYVVEQSLTGVLSISNGEWKYIEPSNRPPIHKNTNTDMGHYPGPQLYHLADDPGERKNVAPDHPDRVRELAEQLARIRKG